MSRELLPAGAGTSRIARVRPDLARIEYAVRPERSVDALAKLATARDFAHELARTARVLSAFEDVAKAERAGELSRTEAALVLLELGRKMRIPAATITPRLYVRTRKRDAVKWSPWELASVKLITTAGVNFLAACFVGTSEPETFNFHALGTSSTAEAITDTGPITPVESRATGTQSNPSANIYRSVGTVTMTANRTIQEHVLMSASSGGTAWDRSLTGGQALNTGDSMQTTYDGTFTGGG